MMKDVAQLFDGWVDGSLSREEVTLFLEALNQDHPEFPGLIDQLLQHPLHTGMGSDQLRERLYKQVMDRNNKQETPVRKLNRFRVRWAAAAVMLLMAGAATWWISTQRSPENVPTVVVNNGTQPQPGGDKAILVLSNGEKIVLDSSAAGQLAVQQGSLVVKSDEGQIDYQQKQQQVSIAEKTAYNTLTTPRGGQYRLTLPDGSKVWLNAASSITYPTRFSGSERVVSVTGEAYFEIEKMAAPKSGKKMPFKVKVTGLASNEKEMEINVLGTHFNVNAYAEEPTARTTLLEGSVKLAKGTDQYLLQPGQQAQLGNDGGIRIVTNVNTEEVLAWKNGFFYFDHTDLRTVMRQIARWYDVSIEYQPGVPNMIFGGEIHRNSNLEDVLKMLEVLKLRFIIDHKKIIVFP